MPVSKNEINQFQTLMRRGAHKDGLDYLLSLTLQHPEDQALWSNAAKLAEQLGSTQAAVKCYSALLTHPNLSADDTFNIGYALKRNNDYNGAIKAYKQSLKLNIRAPEEAHLNMGVIYADFLFDIEAARQSFEAAIKLNPKFLSAYTNLGNLYEETADFDGAKRTYKSAIEAEPRAYEALARLANSYDFEQPDHPVLKKLENAVRNSGATDFDKECLYFALGAARDNLKDYGAAFKAYTKGNTHGIAYGQAYNRTAIETHIDRLIKTFPKNRFAKSDESAVESAEAPSPIFICGMFRSGSTLTEQILGSHPSITPKGELDFFDRVNFLSEFLDHTQVGHAQRTKLRNQYQAHAATHLLETPFFTDKRPDNWLHLGLIKTLFPDAKIIHTVRNSIDNYLSIYFTQFSDSQNYARKIDDIAHYHEQQLRLMEHWQSLFGKDILTVSYDRLIENAQVSTQQALKFLDLPWDETCLSFHKQKNRVKTASYKQVRRPLYATSSGRAKNYAKLL